MTLRSTLWRLSALLGDLSAIRSGRILQRIANRLVWRQAGKVMKVFTFR